MSFFGTVFELIDMRSFSNLWYWIALAAVWSAASYRVLGVPHDLLREARGSAGALAETEALAAIHARRLLRYAEAGGATLLAAFSAAFTALALLGFAYRVEFAQAVFLIAAPLAAVRLGELAAARAVAAGLVGEALRRRLVRMRLRTQLIGMAAIFVSAMWGMYQNLRLGALLG